MLTLHDVTNIWHVPLLLQAQGAHLAVCNQLGLTGAPRLSLTQWRSQLAERWDNLEAQVGRQMLTGSTPNPPLLASLCRTEVCPHKSPLKALQTHLTRLMQCMAMRCHNSVEEMLAGCNRSLLPVCLPLQVTIAMVGKYTGLSDAYLSVLKALQHACLTANRKLEVKWVEAAQLEESARSETPEAHAAAWAAMGEADGILVPGGFGERGVEGMVLAATHARQHSVPYLGICLGMQVAVIEFARNVLGMKEANSTEFAAATPHPVVVFMPEGSTTHLGGTMRLGSPPHPPADGGLHHCQAVSDRQTH